jgi:hypothetical protein
MNLQLPLQISDALDLGIGPVTVRLTPAQGLDLAEDLARKSFRRMFREENEALPKRSRAGTGRRNA